MTTKVTIENQESSNGDVVLAGLRTCEGDIRVVLYPGDERELWITDQTVLFVTEIWPSRKPKPQA